MIARLVEAVIIGAALASLDGPHDAEAKAVIALRVDILTARMSRILEALTATTVRP